MPDLAQQIEQILVDAGMEQDVPLQALLARVVPVATAVLSRLQSLHPPAAPSRPKRGSRAYDQEERIPAFDLEDL